jgi:Flp pilus assembly protein protease CpaA
MQTETAMQTATTFLAVGCLVVIAYQDFMSRSVSWIFFPLLALAGMLHTFGGLHSWRQSLFYAGCNIAFLAIQLVVLMGYFFIRGRMMGGAGIREDEGIREVWEVRGIRGIRGIRDVIDHQIGLGDILFLVAACFFFSPVNFISFYVYSLLLSLAIALLWMLVQRRAGWSIPLAGLQAVFLLLFFGVGALLHYSPLSDHWLLAKIFRP